ncbi:MAG: DegV family protein [Blautia sp.]|nr:DegV family protein [Blautia sp.]
MAEIILLAETGSDIPGELADKEGIYIVPMHVSFGTETKDDGTFPAEEVVNFYKETGILPKTSGCVPEDFTSVFDRIHAEHPDAWILYLAYSAVTTCSYQSAQIACEERSYVRSLDTKQVSAGQYVVVLTMASLLREHPEWTIDDAFHAAKEISESVHMCFVPDSLEFLRAGGRVSNAAALCGNLLKIHPGIEIQDGYLKAVKKYRGKMDKIIPRLVQSYIEEKNLLKNELWLINAPGLSSQSMELAEKAAREAGIQKITWVPTGGVITCHGGPGAFGIVGISAKQH